MKSVQRTILANRRGSTLLVVVLFLALLLPLSAQVAFQSILDLILARTTREQAEAFYAADGLLELALDTLGPLASVDLLVNGPDRVSPSADDGEFPLSYPEPGWGNRYQGHLTISRVGTRRFDLASLVTIANRTKYTEGAYLQLGPHPFTPAILFHAGDPGQIEVGASMQLLGNEEATSPDEIIAPLGSGLVASPIDLSAIASHLVSSRLAVPLAPGPCPAVLGTTALPRLTVMDGDAIIETSVRGSGILLVRGGIHITGSLTFDGIVLASGAILLDEAAQLDLNGTLWQSNPTAPVQLRGRGAIRYDPAALDLADIAAPDILPRTILVLGRRDVT